MKIGSIRIHCYNFSQIKFRQTSTIDLKSLNKDFNNNKNLLVVVVRIDGLVRIKFTYSLYTLFDCSYTIYFKDLSHRLLISFY